MESISYDYLAREKNIFQVYDKKRVSDDDKIRAETMIFIGETGTGKTTTINSFANYLLKTKYEDPHRVVLIEEKVKKSNAHSQTKFITKYYIKSLLDNRVYCFVDTPGFGDSDDYLSMDKYIIDNLEKRFKTDIPTIKAFCFVVKATTTRLSPGQTYIFNKILSIFDKTAKKNILFLLTFADGSIPLCIDALKNFNLFNKKNVFKFNNSGFLPKSIDLDFESGSDNSENDDELDMNHEFWKIGIKSMNKFFKKLNTIDPLSLVLTTEVIRQRKSLECRLVNLLECVKKILTFIGNFEVELNLFMNYESQMHANENYKIKYTYDKWEKQEYTDGFTTTCIKCDHTCHKNCAYSNDDRKIDCCAMTNGYCTECKGNCHWSNHQNLPYTFVVVQAEQTINKEDLKMKYFDAKTKLSFKQQVILGIVNDITKLNEEAFLVIQKINQCINTLSKIALQDNVLTSKDNVMMMIQNEKYNKKLGWQKRVNTLNGIKEQMIYLEKIKNASYNKGDCKAKFIKKLLYDNFDKNEKIQFKEIVKKIAQEKKKGIFQKLKNLF